MKQLRSGRVLATCGMCIALASVTSFLKLFSLPMGGSVTLLSMFFITIIGYFYGLKVSVPAALAYGLVQFVVKPEMYTPLQVCVDYFLAFGSLGLSGVFRRRSIIAGYLLGVTGRFIFATLSGVIFWGEYAWEGWNPVLYSVCYNGMYIYAEALVTIAVLMVPAVRSAIGQVAKMVE